MLQTSIKSNSELYYIFSEGLKKPSEDWIQWFNNGGRETTIRLLRDVNDKLSEEIDCRLPKTIEYNTLRRLYFDSFQIPGPTRVVPIESVYKEWTDNKTNIPLSTKKGFLMGDSAVHMNYLYEMLGIEIPEQFELAPDHLILQLELLAILEESGNRDFINEYVLEHLDWTEQLLTECEKKEWSGFYYEWIKMIHLFFKNRCWEC